MADTAGLGGLNSVYITLEDEYGTYMDPSEGSGAWMPVLSESLKYTEDKYYSPQIRQETIVSSVQQAVYHVEGDIEFEVDANFLPILLYMSRHTVVETGGGAPFTYVAVPSNFGSAYPGSTTAKGGSITVVRNGEGFGYAGCVAGQWVFTIDNGILKCTISLQGLSEQEPNDLDVASWITPSLFGADAHSVYVDAAGASPTFATPSANFNGFTATINYNAEAQNRITPERSATFVKYGETETTYETELDFLTREEYDNMKENTLRSVRLESLKGADNFAAASEAVRLDFNNTAYNTYEVDTPGMGDLVMARTTGRALGLPSGDAFSITCKSSLDLGFV